MMRSLLVGLICLLAGATGALAYSHYLGEGKQLGDLRDQVAKLQSDVASAKSTSVLAKNENEALTSQVQQLIASKDKLQKQIENGASVSATPSPALPNLSGMFGGKDMTGIIKAQTEQRNNERLQMLTTRLHLTPDQIEKVKAAMDAEAKRTEDMTAKMFSGQKLDMKAIVDGSKGLQTSDQVLQSLLTPDQKTAYKQMQSDEKTSRAESMASMQMNQMAPTLNLSQAQRDQVESALYQSQLDSEDPNWIKKNAGTTPGNSTAMLDAQQKAKEDALASILTPDQMATYKQQAEAQLNLQKAMMQKFMPAITTGTTTSAAAPSPGPSPTATPTP